MWILFRCQHTIEFVSGQSLEKPVATEQESIAGLAGHFGVVHLDVWGYAKRPSEDVSIGMSFGLSCVELASPDQVSDDSVVMCELFQAAAPEVV